MTLEILNSQDKVYINLELEDLHIYKGNKFKNILDGPTNYKNNIIYQYLLDNKTTS